VSFAGICSGTLSDEEADLVLDNARRFYDRRREALLGFRNEREFFGIELEHTLLDAETLLPALGLGEAIAGKLGFDFIKSEYGSFQIEQNSGKHAVGEGGFLSAYGELVGQRELIAEEAAESGALVLSTGLTPKFPFEGDDDCFLSRDLGLVQKRLDPKRIKPFVFTGRHHEKVIIDTSDRIWSVINSMHIHYQPRDSRDLIKSYNYSQMVIPLISAISSNASYHNAQLMDEDVRMSMICAKRKSLRGGDTGFIMRYLDCPDDFFSELFSIRPWMRYECGGSREYSDFMSLTEINSYFTQLRLEDDDENPARLEFKIISVQPTVLENISMAMAYLLLVNYLKKNEIPYLDIKRVYSDLFNAMRYGISARLNFMVEDGQVVMPAYRIWDIMLPKIVEQGLSDGLINGQEEKIVLALEDRIINRSTPSRKLRRIIELEGEENGLRKFIEYSHRDVQI
jgi:hypothetical protein